MILEHKLGGRAIVVGRVQVTLNGNQWTEIPQFNWDGRWQECEWFSWIFYTLNQVIE
jgi:hypothetical protein